MEVRVPMSTFGTAIVRGAMSQRHDRPRAPGRAIRGTPSATSSRGCGFYGVLGWLADRWLGTSFLVGVGIVVGAVSERT